MNKGINALEVVLIVFAMFILVGTGIFFGVWFYQKYQITPKDFSSPQPSVTTIIQPSPKLSVNPSPTPVAQTNDKDEISALFAKKYSKNIADVNLTIKTDTGNLAQGGVSFTGENAGAWWLAAKENGVWKIVQDGNGTITCEIIEPYNFPVSMVSECWSETTQKLITRK